MVPGAKLLPGGRGEAALGLRRVDLGLDGSALRAGCELDRLLAREVPLAGLLGSVGEHRQLVIRLRAGPRVGDELRSRHAVLWTVEPNWAEGLHHQGGDVG